MRTFKSLLLVLMASATTVSCVNNIEDDRVAGAGTFDATEESWALSRTCSEGSTVRGIDVSKWQGTIDWDRVATQNVKYAFIRVSDGLRFVDQRFERNWSETKRVGIRRGAYQFFRPALDPIAQAELFLQKLPRLEPGDLPPVLDVEATDGISASTIRARTRRWLDHVEAALGVKPIIYTSGYFWRDQIGSPSWSSDYPLWVAHYTTGCPLTPEPWSSWTFHQFTDSGRISGISGGVDTNYFNGTEADLAALSYQGTPVAPPEPCAALGANGGTIDEADSCVSLEGPQQYWRREPAGFGGEYRWTGAITANNPTNIAEWGIALERGGEYLVSVAIPRDTSASQQARYEILHNGERSEVIIDQTSAVDGRITLGTFEFAAGEQQFVRVFDNTGEASSLNRRVLVDALVLSPTVEPEPEPEPEPSVSACSSLDAGGMISEDQDCVTLEGPAQYWRSVEGGGESGAHVWTGATSNNNRVNFAQWNLNYTREGRHLLQVFIPPNGTSRRARYRIEHLGGTDTVVIDQNATSGYAELGIYNFAPGRGTVVLNDNTGESTSLERKIGVDALQSTPGAQAQCPMLTVDADTLNVRPIPSTAQSPTTRVQRGDRIERVRSVVGQSINGNNNWYRVVANGTAGYISARYATCQ